MEILGFPCNQFGGQEPGTDEEIREFCSTNYQVAFPLTTKIEVNGDGAHELYRYLKHEQPGQSDVEAIKWNFEVRFFYGDEALSPELHRNSW